MPELLPPSVVLVDLHVQSPSSRFTERSPTLRGPEDSEMLHPSIASEHLSLQRINLEHDTNLYRLVHLMSLKFRDGQKFMEAAWRMHGHIALSEDEVHTLPISNETVRDFLEETVDDYKLRSSGKRIEYFVEPGDKSKYRVYSTTGPEFLGPHMDYDASAFPDPTSIFRNYEDPETRFGAELVLTLKDREARRLSEIQPEYPVALEASVDHNLSQVV